MFFTVVCVAFITRIVFLKLNAPAIQSDSGLTTRTLTVKAVRGEIYDRNGKKLVSNSYSYDVYIDAGNFPTSNTEKNNILQSLIGILDNRVDSIFPIDGEYENPTYTLPDNKDSTEYKSFIKMLDTFKLKHDTDCKTLTNFLAKRYGIIDDKGNFTVKKENVLLVMELRYELERQDFSILNPYKIAKNIDNKTLTAIEEHSLNGIEIEKQYSRVYNYPKYASHILGRTGKIQSDDIEYYTEQGYPMDAIVGVDGVEKIFEQYLRGIDGTLVIVEDKNGNRVDEYYKKEPIAGNDVYLTIDIDLQITAEDALAYNIDYIRETAEEKIKTETEKNTDIYGNLKPGAEIPSKIGEDVSAGAATLVNPKTGEIYALASNPTFNLETYSKDYNSLLVSPNQPLYNRALMGNYEPGSTFKIGVAAAALEYGIVNKNTYIYDKGVYSYYNDYQPECWFYTAYNYGHGNMNVISAIQHSCNYYFYDVGRRLTIEKMNSYCSSLGLGEYTGVELPESKGILAGPAYSSSVNKAWVPGDTLQAAIGQSDNTFTPLQLSMYLSTLVNQGTRYKATILHSVREYGSNTPVYEHTVQELGKAQLSDDNFQTIKLGMKNVMENGTAAPVFSDYPIEIGGKTGTAQVGTTKSNNGIFMAFAPYNNPEIVASCIIEQAGGSNEVGITIRKMFNKYFNIIE